MTKLIVGSAALALYGLSGLYFYNAGKKSIKPITITKVETKVEQKIEYIDRVTTRTIKGDTVTEVIHEKGKTETKVVEKEKPVIITNKLSQYSIAGYISFDPIQRERNWQVTAGARLGELPLFLEVGATSRKEILAGIRYEF